MACLKRTTRRLGWWLDAHTLIGVEGSFLLVSELIIVVYIHLARMVIYNH